MQHFIRCCNIATNMDTFCRDGAGEMFNGSEEQLQELYENVIEPLQNVMSESENATIDIYAELLLPTIIAIIKKRCHGCNVDHSSQLQHDICLMQPFAVSVHNYIDEALARITVFEINRIATNRASLMKAVDVPLQESVWREKWLPLTEARVLLLHYCR